MLRHINARKCQSFARQPQLSAVDLLPENMLVMLFHLVSRICVSYWANLVFFLQPPRFSSGNFFCLICKKCVSNSWQLLSGSFTYMQPPAEALSAHHSASSLLIQIRRKVLGCDAARSSFPTPGNNLQLFAGAHLQIDLAVVSCWEGSEQIRLGHPQSAQRYSDLHQDVSSDVETRK